MLNNFKQMLSFLCCRDTTLGCLRPLNLPAFLVGIASRSTRSNFFAYRPWRTWYRFYGNVTLEVYAICGTRNPTTWTCMLFSDLKTQGLGSVYYFRTWKLDTFPALRTLCTLHTLRTLSALRTLLLLIFLRDFAHFTYFAHFKTVFVLASDLGRQAGFWFSIS